MTRASSDIRWRLSLLVGGILFGLACGGSAARVPACGDTCADGTAASVDQRPTAGDVVTGGREVLPDGIAGAPPDAATAGDLPLLVDLDAAPDQPGPAAAVDLPSASGPGDAPTDLLPTRADGADVPQSTPDTPLPTPDVWAPPSATDSPLLDGGPSDGAGDTDATDADSGPMADATDSRSDVPPKANGETCAASGECTSGTCADGVCCATPCAGLCQACNLPGQSGTCAFVPAGQDPKNVCDDQGAATCGNDGFCNGAGECERYASGTVCTAETCTGFVHVGAGRCDGQGRCAAGQVLTCAPFLCASGGACRLDCATDADCVGTSCQNGSCGKRPLGAVCASATDCDSGACAQGVCCASACDGICQSCALAGSAGFCTPVPAGTDPLGQCVAAPATTCGLDGQCDGRSACRFHAAGTICGPETCAAGLHLPASLCDGQGGCRDGNPSPCTPYACGATDCRSACTGNEDCALEDVCAGGKCVPPKPAGAACATGNECAAGACVDGVCCTTPCNGTCERCDLGGQKGTCTSLPAGSDPDGECPDDGAASCNRDGFCDGNGACRRYGQGTVCRAGGCVGSTRTLDATCDGAGQCSTPATLSCAPYTCGSDGTCRSTCSLSGECAAPNPCLAGSCGKLSLGSSCGQDADCASGTCAQGVCCSTACDGLCQSCALPGRQGSCSDVPEGQDPLGQCDATAASTCGQDGTCDGQGGCRLHVAGTLCAAATCSAGAATPARTCDGQGTCQTATMTACDPYVCGASACKTSCSGAGDCTATAACLGGLCQPKKAGGQACGSGTECTSGFCADSVCCDSGCTGTCRSCNLPGQAGICTPIGAGTDPDGECADQGAATCGQDGSCDGSGACHLYTAGTVCAAATCAGTAHVSEAACDGQGACVAPASNSCSPYACGPGGACLADCTDDSQCISPNVCQSGSCGLADPNACGGGPACPAGQRCSGGACVCDGTSCPSGCCDQGNCATIGYPLCGQAAGTCQTCDPTLADHCAADGTCACGPYPACSGNRIRCLSGGCRQCVTSSDCNAAEVCVTSVCTACGGASTSGKACGNGLTCCGSTCLDMTSDPSNCGSCGSGCSSNHMATRTCSAGQCNGTCAFNYGDCNADKRSDGCETNLVNNAMNCGMCGRKCLSPLTCADLPGCTTGSDWACGEPVGYSCSRYCQCASGYCTAHQCSPF